MEKEIIEVLGKIDFSSKDGKEIAEKYIKLDFVKDQISNIILSPVMIAFAWLIYKLGTFIEYAIQNGTF